jgi:hypothetical protein
MTLRAAILGLLGAAFICGFTYYNDCVLHQSLLISDHMPVLIYGALLLFVAVGNPLLRRLHARLVLRPAELALIMALVLSACCVPAFGLMRTFTASLMLPHHHALKEPAWREHEVVKLVPEQMLADVSIDEDATLTAFVQGLSEGNQHIAWGRIPWRAWTRTLAFWLPIVLLLWIGLAALALAIHPQWAQHEQLPYPIAAFADSLLRPRDGVRPLLHSRLFWLGCGSVWFVYAWNYLQGWFPELVPFKLNLNFWPLADLFPTFMQGGGGRLLVVNLRFMPIGFAFFLATEVSFSLGIGPYLWCLVVGLFAGFGIALESGDYQSLRPASLVNFGAYLGMLLAILYCGRYYYANLLKGAVGLRGSAGREQVWALRVFLVCAAGFTALLCTAGLDWPLAVGYAFGTIVIFVVISRISAETGLFFIQVSTFPCVVLWGLLGTEALGPRAIAVLCLLSGVLLLDPREALLPYLVNVLRLLEWHRLKLGRSVLLCVAAIVVGLCIAVPVTLYFQYDRGLETVDSWTQLASSYPFTNALAAKRELAAAGTLAAAESRHGLERFRHLQPNRACLLGFLAGLGLVLLCAAGRVRYTRWPIHPVLFLIWGTYPAWRFAPCFLLGWLLKGLVVRYGGSQLYRLLLPLFTGLIAGEILGYLTGIAAGLTYSFGTGELPRYTLWR